MRGARGRVVAAIAVLAAAVPAAARADDQVGLSADGAWSWFADPRAVYHAGAHHRTYVGYISSAGDVDVASYDHDTGATLAAILSPAFQVDDHANPAVHIRRDGRIVVFWSAHQGSQMYYRVSEQPEDVSAWGATRVVGTNSRGGNGYTYPNPVSLSGEGGRLYLFWRGGNWQPTFSTSDDDGDHWSPARTLVDFPGQRPYVKYAGDGASKIGFAFTEGNPGSYDTSIYYAEYRDGQVFKADGTKIADASALPIAPSQADKVYDASAGGARAWIWDVAEGTSGPTIVYVTINSASDRRYRYATWTGSAWSDHEITPAGPTFVKHGKSSSNYSAGVVLDHADPSTVYLSRPVADAWEIERWHTGDGGATWTSAPITSGSSADNVRPVVPRNEPAEAMKVLWMSGTYAGYTSYHASLLGMLGPAAPVLPTRTAPAPEPVAAAPAAAPAPTAGRHASAIRITVSRRIVTGRQRVRVSGVLSDRASGARVRWAQLVLLARDGRHRHWRRTASSRTDRRGRLVLSRRITRRTDFKLLYAGDAARAGSSSRVQRVYFERLPSRTGPSD
jgi:hypothetical protein